MIRRATFHTADLVMISAGPPRPDPITTGDTVRLRSGGPTMIVAGIADGLALCLWPKGIEDFPVVCLQHEPERN